MDIFRIGTTWATVRAVPKSSVLGERRAIRLLGADFEIDGEGRVWRIRKWGVPCSPCRAEYQSTLGYLVVSFGNENIYAHRLVYQHFFGDIPEAFTVNHKNGDKADNRPSNLEAVTNSENRRHAYRVLGEKPLRGLSKLTAEKVAEIRLLARSGVPPRDLAATHGVSYQCVLWALQGRTWRSSESGYDPSVHKFVRTAQRGYKLSAEAEGEVVSLIAAGASMKSVADRYCVSQGTIGSVIRRARDRQPRTTERLQRQRQRYDLSARQIARFREFAEAPRALRGGTDNWLIARGWISVVTPPWPPAATGTGTITSQGIEALQQVEARAAEIEGAAKAHGR